MAFSFSPIGDAETVTTPAANAGAITLLARAIGRRILLGHGTDQAADIVGFLVLGYLAMRLVRTFRP